MELTIIVIIHNTKPFITNLLFNLKKINCNQIFLLNGVFDSSIIRLFENYKKLKKGVKTLKTSKLLRPPVATNMLLREVKTDYVFIMDSDILTTEKDLSKIYTFMKKNKKYGAVQGLLIYPQTNKIQSTGHLFYEYSDYYGQYKSFLNTLSGPLERQALSAGFSMYPMKVINETKGFDEFYIHNKTGVEFTTRIKSLGYGVCCLPEAKGYHFHSLFRKEIKNKTFNGIAKYWATYGDFLIDDLPKEIINNPFMINFSNYYIVDCSTINNLPKFLDSIGIKKTHLILKVTDLEEPSIILHNKVPKTILTTKRKILWICNNYNQIVNNFIVFDDKNRKSDYIIDMSGNVIPIIKLLQNRLSM